MPRTAAARSSSRARNPLARPFSSTSTTAQEPVLRARPGNGCPAATVGRDVTVWRPILARAAVLWVPLAAAVTAISGVVYAADLNGLRSAANDPQIQMVEEAVASLNASASPQSVVPSTTVDMSTSLRPYLIVFDGAHRPLASSVTLHGRQPALPPSVLDGLQSGRQDRITWQPEPGVRDAAVIEPWRGGAVLAGRSLRLTEERETDLELLVAAGWLGTLLLTALAAVVVGIFHPLPGPARPPGAGTVVGDRTATGPDREAPTGGRAGQDRQPVDALRNVDR
jgi:hypothetical protein